MEHTLPAARAKSVLGEWALNVLTLLISLAIVYAGAELYVSYAVDDGMQFDLEMWRYASAIKRQSANPAIGHEHTPNTRAHLMGADVAISSQGLRDREFTLTPPPGRTRILMLGDSLTFGWGVEAHETYSKRLEAMLQQAGHDVEVINTGVGNYNTEMEVAYFLERGAKLKPHYVVLNYFINDAEPTPRDRSNFLSRNSRAFVYFASRVDMALRLAGVGQKTDWKTYYAALYEGDEGIGRVAAAVERLAAYCRKHGIRLWLANQPELRNPADYPFPQVDRLIERIAAANQLKYIPLLPAVRDLEPETLWVTRPDPHPSAVAHEAFAKALYRVFDAELPARAKPVEASDTRIVRPDLRRTAASSSRSAILPPL
jgi:lysophospholipase L1-like esterase